jgi:uncharacterized protein YwgA
MTREAFRWVAAVIAAHPNREISGRTRLQKTIKLLQSVAFPTDYTYITHFYGPYSEDLQSDVRLLENMGLIIEIQKGTATAPAYVIRAESDVQLDEIINFQPFIDKMAGTDAIILELAATYDAFREQWKDHNKALERLRLKKGPKCSEEREEQALLLLKEFGIPYQKK